MRYSTAIAPFSTRALRPQTLAALSLTALLAIGCAGVNPKRIAPQQIETAGRKIPQSVQVMEVTGGQKTVFGGADMINDDQFQKALVLTLRQSGLFSDVSTDHGDLKLYAVIRSQEQRVERFLQYTGRMVVTYRFANATTNNYWTETFESEFSSTTFSGSARAVRAREGAGRENLKSFLQSIRDRWPTN